MSHHDCQLQSEAMRCSRRLIGGAVHPFDDARRNPTELPDAPKCLSQLRVAWGIPLDAVYCRTPITAEEVLDWSDADHGDDVLVGCGVGQFEDEFPTLVVVI